MVDFLLFSDCVKMCKVFEVVLGIGFWIVDVIVFCVLYDFDVFLVGDFGFW